MSLHPTRVLYLPTEADIKAFGITVRWFDRDPVFEFAAGTLWVSAGTVFVYDDGSVHVTAHGHLTARESTRLFGMAEEAFHNPKRVVREQRYSRRRKSKANPTPCWSNFWWVEARPSDDGFSKAIENYLIASGKHPQVLKSSLEDADDADRRDGLEVV